MRLIDADAYLKKLRADPLYYLIERFGVDGTIEAMPTIDAESVIRCKDCNFCGEIDENGWHCCENLGVGMPKNGFCSDAERRENENAD